MSIRHDLIYHIQIDSFGWTHESIRILFCTPSDTILKLILQGSIIFFFEFIKKYQTGFVAKQCLQLPFFFFWKDIGIIMGLLSLICHHYFRISPKKCSCAWRKLTIIKGIDPQNYLHSLKLFIHMFQVTNGFLMKKLLFE